METHEIFPERALALAVCRSMAYSARQTKPRKGTYVRRMRIARKHTEMAKRENNSGINVWTTERQRLLKAAFDAREASGSD